MATITTADDIAALTEAHRLAQGTIGAETMQLIMSTWSTLDLAAIERTLEAWLRNSERIITSQYSRSAELAAGYGNIMQRLEIGPNVSADDLVSPAELLTSDEIRPSLLVTGPGRYFQALRKGNTQEVASLKAQVAAARSAQRLAMTGSRRTLTRTGLGWRRSTSGKPCQFCAMLAGRGAVYNSEEAAAFQAHDGCSCHPEPVFRREAQRSDEELRYKQLYDEAQAARRSGDIVAGGKNPALNALRTHMSRLGLL
jgi:hypothetical protein